MNDISLRKFLEAADEAIDSMNEPEEINITDDAVEPAGTVNMDALLDELNSLFTPVLVMQDFEQKISDEANMELAEASALTERNVVQLDDAGRMAQLTSVCAMLIAKQKNTTEWQMFKKAAALKRQSKIDIQKHEHDLAKELAQKYLVMVSTTNNSSVARKAAEDLLPQTQH